VKIGARSRIDRGVRIGPLGTVTIGARAHLEPAVWLKLVSPHARVSIGDFTFLGRGTEIDVSESVTLGAHVLVAPGVFITDHAHNIAAGRLIDEQGLKAGSVSIGDDVWLGTRAIVLPSVSIGPGAVVGAGAVVTHDVAANAIVAGVPARLLRYRT
jgi:acetyltransferase-like isoleucine patch superfamily enzyme